jgi:hypothetical protein
VDQAGQKKQDYEKTKANFDKKVILEWWIMFKYSFILFVCYAIIRVLIFLRRAQAQRRLRLRMTRALTNQSLRLMMRMAAVMRYRKLCNFMDDMCVRC